MESVLKKLRGAGDVEALEALPLLAEPVSGIKGDAPLLKEPFCDFFRIESAFSEIEPEEVGTLGTDEANPGHVDLEKGDGLLQVLFDAGEHFPAPWITEAVGGFSRSEAKGVVVGRGRGPVALFVGGPEGLVSDDCVRRGKAWYVEGLAWTDAGYPRLVSFALVA